MALTANIVACAIACAGPAVGTVVVPASLAAQSMEQISRFMQDGGAWLSLPIVEGKGSYTGLRIPTMGMRFEGWFQVADVHSGEWKIQVVDLQGSSNARPVVDVTAEPGVQIPIAYDAGAMAQVQVEVEWSEPADTTLWVWVGLPDREGPGRPGG